MSTDAERFSKIAQRMKAAGENWDAKSAWQLIQDALNPVRKKPASPPSGAEPIGAETLTTGENTQPGGGNKELTIGRGTGYNPRGGKGVFGSSSEGAVESTAQTYKAPSTGKVITVKAKGAAAVPTGISSGKQQSK